MVSLSQYASCWENFKSQTRSFSYQQQYSMGSDEEGKALATSDFWDARYEKADGEHPTHEWFRSFAALKPFFDRHLFQQWPASSCPHILHLGSGDSVRLAIQSWDVG